VGELGRGGMGVVYKALHLRLNRLVALKMVQDSHCLHPEHLVRFLSEAEAVAGVQHPYIAQIYEVGQMDGRPYYTMEFVAGGNLAQKTARAPQPPRQAAHMVEMLARAVQVAHQCGIIHRDLKPDNVLLAADGTPRITDFGLAKRLHGDVGLTHTGEILGTPSYMAPEQADGLIKDLGPCTDVYALGAILYELLTGRPPFVGVTVLDVLDQVKKKEPLPFGRVRIAVPRDLETICLKCLHKEPRRRYASAEELADDLRRFLASEPIRARPPNFVSRTWLWCHRTERVRDAGAFMVFFGVVATIWCLSGVAFIASGLIHPLRPASGIVQLVVFIFACYLPLIWIGLGTMAKRRPWLWAGAVVAAVDLVLSILCMVGSNPFSDLCDVGGLHSDPNIRYPVFSLLGTLTMVQLVGYGIALLAYYSNRSAAH
jgi:hypothetical protein